MNHHDDANEDHLDNAFARIVRETLEEEEGAGEHSDTKPSDSLNALLTKKCADMRSEDADIEDFVLVDHRQCN